MQKKPWGPEEVPTAFIFFNSSDQQRTNPSLGLFHHHQFLIAICSIIISVSLTVFHSWRFSYQTLGNMSTPILCFCVVSDFLNTHAALYINKKYLLIQEMPSQDRMTTNLFRMNPSRFYH
jgi:hypothetical protein